MSIKTKRRGFSACVTKGQDEDEPLIRRTRCFGFQQEEVTSHSGKVQIESHNRDS